MRLPICLVLCALTLFGEPRRVAVTIDDLPLGGGSPAPCTAANVIALTGRLLQPIRERHIPVIGFVNEGRCPEIAPDDFRRILRLWIEAGAELGNHTYSHMDLNTHTAREFERDVVRGEGILRPLLAQYGRELRYLRHPFLHAGGPLTKRREVERFLLRRGYQVAPVTLDNSDYMFAAVYGAALAHGDRDLADRVRGAYLPYMESILEFFEKRSVYVTGHEIAQTLLVHVNELNAVTLPGLLDIFRKRGYRFVSLGEALKDPAYSLPDDYAGPGGFSWIHRWSITKGMPNRGEPGEPLWIGEAYRASR